MTRIKATIAFTLIALSGAAFAEEQTVKFASLSLCVSAVEIMKNDFTDYRDIPDGDGYYYDAKSVRFCELSGSVIVACYADGTQKIRSSYRRCD